MSSNIDMSNSGLARMVLGLEAKTTGFEQAGADMQKLQKKIVDLNRTMSRNMKNFQKEFMEKLDKSNMITEEASKNTEKYRKEMMGLRKAMIAFFFVTRELQKMMAPAAELVGIFDIWNIMMTYTFLPSMLIFMEKVMLPLMDWVLKMPDDVRLLIGVFTALGVALGSISVLNKVGAFDYFKEFVNVLKTFKTPKDLMEVFGKGGMLEQLGKTTVGKAIGITLSIYLAFEFYKSTKEMLSDLTTNWNSRLMSLLYGIGGGAVLGFTFGGSAGALIGATIGFGLALVINILDIAWENNVDDKLIEAGTGIKNKLSDWGRGIHTWWDDGDWKFWKKDGDKAIITDGTLHLLKTKTGELNDEFVITTKTITTTLKSGTKNNEIVIKSSMEKINDDTDYALEDYKYTWKTGLDGNLELIKEYAANAKTILNSIPGDTNGSGSVTFDEGGHGWDTMEEAYREVANYTGGRQLNDFIMRPGSPPISINPNDTLIGGMNPNGGTLGALSGGNGVTINQTINVTTSNKDEISRMINQNNKTLVMDIKRMVGS